MDKLCGRPASFNTGPAFAASLCCFERLTRPSMLLSALTCSRVCDHIFSCLRADEAGWLRSQPCNIQIQIPLKATRVRSQLDQLMIRTILRSRACVLALRPQYVTCRPAAKPASVAMALKRSFAEVFQVPKAVCTCCHSHCLSSLQACRHLLGSQAFLTAGHALLVQICTMSNLNCMHATHQCLQ